MTATINKQENKTQKANHQNATQTQLLERRRGEKNLFRKKPQSMEQPTCTSGPMQKKHNNSFDNFGLPKYGEQMSSHIHQIKHTFRTHATKSTKF